jgi:hypothetical protein
MRPSHGRRTWVKLWVNDWLEGTTRYQMSDAQRAFWVDLLAMAGRSRFGGVVCSGRDGEKWIGYPLSKFQGLLAETIDVEATLELFQGTGKITMEISGEGPRRLYTIFITNWAHYQSEYERKRGEKSRRHGTLPPNVPQMSAGMSHSMSLKTTSTEGEVEREIESEGETERRKPRSPAAAAATTATTVVHAFRALGHEPFGPPEFQEIWTEEWSAAGEDPNWTDLMERAITRCRSLGVSVPGLFYKHKHEIENGEVKMRYKVAPL